MVVRQMSFTYPNTYAAGDRVRARKRVKEKEAAHSRASPTLFLLSVSAALEDFFETSNHLTSQKRSQLTQMGSFGGHNSLPSKKESRDWKLQGFQSRRGIKVINLIQS